jgi:hypothetical protein
MVSKEYYKKHREELLEYSHNYYLKHKDDMRERNRNYYNSHKETILANQRRWWSKNKNTKKYKEQLKRRTRKYNEKLRLEVLTHYGGNPPRCACKGCYYHINDCPIEFLSIDHIHGGGNKHRKELRLEGNNLYSWLRVNHFPEGYRVLCYNCNLSIGFRGYCPHEGG